MRASYSDWIGRTKEAEELMALAPVHAAAAMLDDTATEFVPGSPLPPLWQWFFFLPRVPQSRLGLDGHPQRGGFCRRSSYPGACLPAPHAFLKPLLIGRPAHGSR